MTAEDSLINSIATELEKSSGCRIEYSSDYRKEDDGVHCYVRFDGELARVQDRCCLDFIRLTEKERSRAVELVIRSLIKYGLPALTLPDEVELSWLINKELE